MINSNNSLADYIRTSWIWTASFLAALVWLSGAKNIVELSTSLQQLLDNWSAVINQFLHTLFELCYIPIFLSHGQTNLLTLVLIICSIWWRSKIFKKSSRIFKNSSDFLAFDTILYGSFKEFLKSFLKIYFLVALFSLFIFPVLLGSSLLDDYSNEEPIRYFFLFVPAAVLLACLSFSYLIWKSWTIEGNFQIKSISKWIFLSSSRPQNFNNQAILSINIFTIALAFVFLVYSIWFCYLFYTKLYFVNFHEASQSMIYTALYLLLAVFSFLAFHKSAKPVAIILISGISVIIGDKIFQALAISLTDTGVI